VVFSLPPPDPDAYYLFLIRPAPPLRVMTLLKIVLFSEKIDDGPPFSPPPAIEHFSASTFPATVVWLLFSHCGLTTLRSIFATSSSYVRFLLDPGKFYFF